MAAKDKQGTITKVERSVVSATKKAVTAAEEYVVEPVSRALGLTGKDRTTKKRPATKKRTQRKSPERAAKRPAKRRAATPRQRMRPGSGIE